MALSFFNLGAWGALYAITPEVYPTLLRGDRLRLGRRLRPDRFHPRSAGGAGAARAGGNNVLLFAVFAAFFVLAAVATWGLPELRGEPLEAAALAT